MSSVITFNLIHNQSRKVMYLYVCLFFLFLFAARQQS